MRGKVRRARGQSTVEFALMIPVMISVFFLIMEANVFFTSLHMTAYAAFSSARSWEVCDPKEMGLGGSFPAACTQWVDQETKSPLLTGYIYPGGQGNLLTADRLSQSPYPAGTDGVTIAVADYAMLPYSRLLLNYCPPGAPDGHCEAAPYVPTHLGPSGFDPTIYNNVRDGDGTNDGVTDNNQSDSQPTAGTVGNGHGGNGHGHGNGNSNGNGNGNGNGHHGG